MVKKMKKSLVLLLLFCLTVSTTAITPVFATPHCDVNFTQNVDLPITIFVSWNGNTETATMPQDFSGMGINIIYNFTVANTTITVGGVTEAFQEWNITSGPPDSNGNLIETNTTMLLSSGSSTSWAVELVYSSYTLGTVQIVSYSNYEQGANFLLSQNVTNGYYVAIDMENFVGGPTSIDQFETYFNFYDANGTGVFQYSDFQNYSESYFDPDGVANYPAFSTSSNVIEMYVASNKEVYYEYNLNSSAYYALGYAPTVSMVQILNDGGAGSGYAEFEISLSPITDFGLGQPPSPTAPPIGGPQPAMPTPTPIQPTATLSSSSAGAVRTLPPFTVVVVLGIIAAVVAVAYPTKHKRSKK